MSIGFRDQRVEVFAYSDASIGGRSGDTYTRVPSPAPDGAWWARIEPVTAREAEVAAAQEHRVDVVIAFSDEVTGLTAEGIIRHGDTVYQITGINPKRLLREIHVQAVHALEHVAGSVIG